MNFDMVQVEETPYLYEERTCGMDPKDISAAMGDVFHSVMAFMKAHGIAPAGQAMSVYYTYDPDKMTFRAGFSVLPEDLAKAEGTVKADVTPAGKVLSFVHTGPYSELRNSYGEMMTYAEQNGLKIRAPAWEVYVNDPATVPEEELRTDVFVSLA
ncbi:MAG: GyrI-like domain-containing protein [Hyphomicrobiales bacterium]|nr:GyrI-like domain-containing protein [Hyphomicrobiales bacterium]